MPSSDISKDTIGSCIDHQASCSSRCSIVSSCIDVVGMTSVDEGDQAHPDNSKKTAEKKYRLI